MHEQLGDLHRVVEGVGTDDAHLARDRVEGLDAARERAGMRHGGAAPAFGLAELDRDDRLVGGARHAAGGLEFRQLRDRLDIDDDHLELGLIGEESDVIADRKAGFVPAGDQIFRPDAGLLQRLIGEDHHAAALPDQRDRARPHGQGKVLGQSDQAALGADIAHAVRARHAEPGLRDDGGELASERRGLAIEAFSEAALARTCPNTGIPTPGNDSEDTPT